MRGRGLCGGGHVAASALSSALWRAASVLQPACMPGVWTPRHMDTGKQAGMATNSGGMYATGIASQYAPHLQFLPRARWLCARHPVPTSLRLLA